MHRELSLNVQPPVHPWHVPLIYSHTDPETGPIPLRSPQTVSALLLPLSPARPLPCTLTRPQSQRLLPSLEVSASQLAGRRAGPRDGHPTATAPTRVDGDEAVSSTASSPRWRAWRCVFSSGFRSFLHGVKPQGPTPVPGCGSLPVGLTPPAGPAGASCIRLRTARHSNPATGAASARARLRRRSAESSSDAPRAAPPRWAAPLRRAQEPGTTLKTHILEMMVPSSETPQNLRHVLVIVRASVYTLCSAKERSRRSLALPSGSWPSLFLPGHLECRALSPSVPHACSRRARRLGAVSGQ